MELFLLTKRRNLTALLTGMILCAQVICSTSVCAFEIPQEGLLLLAESTVESCEICIEQLHKKAFKELNKQFIPGKFISTDARCRFIKTKKTNTYEFTLSCYPDNKFLASLPEGSLPPQVILRFHTQDNHLVGIAAEDFTEQKFLNLYDAASPQSLFEGRLQIIAFAYGNAPAYNYFEKTRTLEVHVKITELHEIKP